MKKILSLALVALATACSSEKEKSITYAAPRPPESWEETAIRDAETTLQASVGALPADPNAGAPGLAEQLAGDLGGYTASVPAPGSTKLAQAAVRQAFDTGGLDPGCVTAVEAGGVTTFTWGQYVPCHVEVSNIGMTVVLDVTGTLTSNATTGKSSWGIQLVEAMTWVSDGQPTMSMAGTSDLAGSMTVTADTIDIGSSSNSDVTVSVQGITDRVKSATTLSAALEYQAGNPLCITGGTLRLEQRVEEMGVEQVRGWDFAWQGCGPGLFTISDGT